ncbi:DNA-binding protein [Mycobacterium sp. CBMA271]|uniref:OB-fold domain-containing protein n=1 Tax=unclassified Mycobacteroides TaxID=2618759 RepID=UPI001327ED0D|nr:MULTISPECIES: OB-fold domain-containing protein [unclassified Mycobacteroides]MUM15868.1 DNA-binding protein [Mycobacteroides sp. CBMA 326]MUM24479.1 DNA-binding protein [Mycobacteroides sp. CBMA 271]
MIDQSAESLRAPYTIEFGFERTVGPKIGTFLGGLRDARLFGVRTASGQVLCPVLEFDPADASATGELVELEPKGVVLQWTWVPRRPTDELETDFAWALIRIAGTDNAMFHAVDVGGKAKTMRNGLPVAPRWRPDRIGAITDIVCFEPVGKR